MAPPEVRARDPSCTRIWSRTASSGPAYRTCLPLVAKRTRWVRATPSSMRRAESKRPSGSWTITGDWRRAVRIALAGVAALVRPAARTCGPSSSGVRGPEALMRSEQKMTIRLLMPGKVRAFERWIGVVHKGILGRSVSGDRRWSREGASVGCWVRVREGVVPRRVVGWVGVGGGWVRERARGGGWGGRVGSRMRLGGRVGSPGVGGWAWLAVAR